MKRNELKYGIWFAAAFCAPFLWQSPSLAQDCATDDDCEAGTRCALEPSGGGSTGGSSAGSSGYRARRGRGRVRAALGTCTALPDGSCDMGEGCAEGLTCVRDWIGDCGGGSTGGTTGETSGGSDGGSDGTTGGGDGNGTSGEDGGASAGCGARGRNGKAQRLSAAVCEEGRYGSCVYQSAECDSNADCSAGFSCVVTGGGGGCDENGCTSFEIKTCEYRPPSCATSACPAGLECVDVPIYGGCSGGTVCDENGCTEIPPVCTPDTIEKQCLIAYDACAADGDCAAGGVCLAFSSATGDLSVPEYWSVNGPVLSCVPPPASLLAQTSYGLPEAPRNGGGSSSGGGNGGSDSGGGSTTGGSDTGSTTGGGSPNSGG